MSDQETTRQVGHITGTDSPDDLSRLSELARQAFEQHRTTDCLDLTRAILLIDPENAEAQAMRTSMRTALHQDLERARSVFRSTDDAASHPRAVVHPRSSPAHRTDVTAPAAPKSPTTTPAVPESLPQPEALVDAVPLFRETLSKRRTRPRKWRPTLLDAAAVLVVLALGIAAIPMYRSFSSPRTPDAVESVLAAETIETGTLDGAVSNGLELAGAEATNPAPVLESGNEPLVPVVPPAPVNLMASQPANARPDAVVAPAAAFPRQAVNADQTAEPPVTAATGTLAVSAPVSTEIYVNGRYGGSAPVSLDLPAGTHTLEYRHGNLRKAMVHVIRPGETTNAAITFEVSVSINAQPWANVFLEGVEKKLLGQTPLSGVQLPVGSVLIFENPKFQAKRYRIIGNETGIQMVFP